MIDRADSLALPRWLGLLLLANSVLIIGVMPVHAFISTWGGTAIGPLEIRKGWKELLLVLLAVVVTVWLSLRPARWRVLFADKLAWPIIGFIVVLAVVTALNAGANGQAATLAGLAMGGRYFLLFALAYVAFRFMPLGRDFWDKLRHGTARFLIVAGVLLSLFGILQVHVLPANFLGAFGYGPDTIAPFTMIDDNPAALRAFATLRGPNDFGAYLILPLVLSVIYARRSGWWGLASVAIAVGIIESSSRSAWVGALIALGVLAGLTYGRSLFRSRRWLYAAAASVLVLLGVFAAALTIPSVRLEVFHSSPTDPSLTEGSTDAHWAATAGGVARVLQNPLGCGAGCAGPASYYGMDPKISENYLVQIAEEFGVIGLVLWLIIASTVAYRLWQERTDYLARALLASFIGLSAIALWLHTWADDPLSLTWWGLAGATLGYHTHKRYDKQERNANKQNTHGKTKKQTQMARAGS